jgi:predicted DCC family thiol-disulfide oxidoreductase YuxK
VKTLTNKLIIYDSNCKVCTSLRDIVLKLAPIPEEQVVPYGSLSAELSARVDPAKFRNGMALIDTSDGETIYGSEGVAYIFSSQYRILDFLLRSTLILQVFTFLYRTLAYNRYIIAAPKSRFVCDCFPDKVVRYRIAYILIALLTAIALTAWLGISLRDFFPELTSFEAAMQMILIVGTGWVAQLIVMGIILPEKILDYAGHLGSIMVVGLLILVPWMLYETLGGAPVAAFPALSVVASSSTMLYLHIERARHLELSWSWTMSWFLFLQAGAAGWIYMFHVH